MFQAVGAVPVQNIVELVWVAVVFLLGAALGGVVAEYGEIVACCAHTPFAGLAWSPSPLKHVGVWLCAGICDVVSVTDSVPADSPIT